MSKKKGRMPIRSKGALPRPRGNKEITDVIKKGVKAAYWDVPRTVVTSLNRAVGAAGKSLLKDYQGSRIQQRFEGTPITAETTFETQASPMKSMSRAVKPVKRRGTISYPDEGPVNPERRDRYRDAGVKGQPTLDTSTGKSRKPRPESRPVRKPSDPDQKRRPKKKQSRSKGK